MTDTRFRPRSYCEPPKDFGTSKPIAWPDNPTYSIRERDQLAASRIQDELARQVRDALHVDGVTIVEHALAIGIEPIRLGRILRGDVIIRLEEMVNLRRNLRLRTKRRKPSEAGPDRD